MTYLLLTVLVFWTYFPNFAINLGPLPMFLAILVFLAATTLLHFQKVFVTPGWLLYAMLGAAALISVTNSIQPDNTLEETLAFALMITAVPFAALWFHNSQDYYRVLTWVILILNVIVCMYSWTYSSDILSLHLARFGPLQLSINGTGYLLIMGSAVSWPMIVDNERSRWARLLAGLSIVINLYTILFHVGSRASFLIQCMAMLIWVTYLVFSSQRKARANRPHFLPIVLLLMLVVMVLLYVAYTNLQQDELPEILGTRFGLLFSPEQDSSIAMRQSFANKAWLMFQDFPVFGGGFNSFIYYEYGQYAPVIDSAGRTRYVTSDQHWPHSTYLKLLAETGLLGITSFLLLILWQFRKLFKAIRINREAMTRQGGIWLWLICHLLWAFSHDAINQGFFVLLLMVQALILNQLWTVELHWRKALARQETPVPLSRAEDQAQL